MKHNFKEFNKFVIPSIISAIFISIYTILDGIFIGRKVGETALAGINYAFPIAAFIQSVGFGLGLASAIKINIKKGMNKETNDVLGASYISFLVSILVLMPLLYFTRNQLLNMFGATNEIVHKEAEAYIKVVILFFPVELLSQGLIPILRSHGYNKYCMTIVSLGYIINIILEYIFLYNMSLGLPGVAYSVLISQGFVILMSVILLTKKEFWPKFNNLFENMLSIFKSSFSSFGLAYSSNLITIIINKSCSIYANDLAVAAYTAMSYISYMIQKLMQSIADGIQPLLSFAKGKDDKRETKFIFKTGLILGVTISMLFMVVVLLFTNQLAQIFKLSNSLEYFKSCAICISLSFVFVAITRISISYFNSKDKKLYSNILIYLEPFFVLFFALVFPLFMKINGIWISFAFSDILLSIIILIFLIIESRGEKMIKVTVRNKDNEEIELYYKDNTYYLDANLTKVYPKRELLVIFQNGPLELKKPNDLFKNKRNFKSK